MKYFLLSVFAFCAVSCHHHAKKFPEERYEQNKKRLEENEKNEPLDFLKIEGGSHKNIFGKTVIKTVITNYAAVCSYRDVRIKILSFDPRGKMVEEHEDIVPDVIKPRASVDYKTKYHFPQTVDSIAFSIMSATAVIDSTLK